jgi:hypothetical protein
MTAYVSGKEQTFFDVAITAYGSLDGGIMSLLKYNPELIQSGGEVNESVVTHVIDPLAVVNERIKAKMQISPPSTRVLVTGFGLVDGDGDLLIDDNGFSLIS